MDRPNPEPLPAPSAVAMGRAVPRRFHSPRNGLVAVAASAAGVAADSARRPGGGRTLAVGDDRIVISEVVRGRFDDFIQIRGRATPARTVFVDTAQGGQVEAIHVEDGAIV